VSGRTLVVDFDGTVTQEDLLDVIASRFGDPVVYRQVEDGLDEGRMPLREVITREFEPVRNPLEEIVDWELENVHIRPGFRELVELAAERGWRFVIVSSGFHELIEPLLARAGVVVELLANRVDPRPDGWVVDWRYGEACAVCGQSCKRSTVAALATGSELVYVGDGYSDRCAGESADRVFATAGLAGHLERKRIPYEPFRDFFDIAAALAPSPT
jgi:2-hydroxy-3-keto-5-methylthiopentenyl-1-phosphate phosphatase